MSILLTGFQSELGDKEVTVLFGTGLETPEGEELHGDADWFTRVIRVDSNDDTIVQLDTVIHECLHIAFPWMREWLVNKISSQIATILWQTGWRLPKKEGENGGQAG